MFLKKLSQEVFAKSSFFNLDLQKTRIFLKTHTKRLMFHYQLFNSVQLAFLVLGSIFDGGVFQKILIFCYFKKMAFLQKKSWLNFLTNNVFIIHSKLLTILLESFLAIFSQS